MDVIQRIQHSIKYILQRSKRRYYRNGSISHDYNNMMDYLTVPQGVIFPNHTIHECTEICILTRVNLAEDERGSLTGSDDASDLIIMFCS